MPDRIYTRSGVPGLPDLPWGSHLCHFYKSAEDLQDVLVPFFDAGLKGNELCLWITAPPYGAAKAREAMARAVPDVDQHLASGQLQIIDYDELYRQPRSLAPEHLLAAWLDHEAKAVSDGYAGVRITGNVAFLQAHEWAPFCTYEAAVNEAFQSRRIVALCSYCTDTLGPEEVLDVVRTHHSALIRRDADWEQVHGATHTLLGLSPQGTPQHEVCFFESESFLRDQITRFVKAGVAANEAVLVLAAPERLAWCEAAVADLGRDPNEAVASGQLLLLDAEEALGRVLRAGLPDEGRLRDLIAPIVDRAREAYGGVRIYGELVDLLCQRGDARGAVVLEKIWNDFLRGQSVRLLCGYAYKRFCADDDGGTFRDICDTHARVRPGEQSAACGTEDSRNRLIADLQQRAIALESEVCERRRLEADHRRLLQTERLIRAQVSRLQSLSAALSEVVTLQDVVRVVLRELPVSAGADQVSLALYTRSGMHLVGELGEMEAIGPDHPLAVVESVCVSIRDPSFICVPLRASGQRLGALGLAYRSPRLLTAADRALLEDFGRQVSMAVDRGRLYEEAQQAIQKRDEFLSIASHELRTPLTSLKLQMDALLARARRGAPIDPLLTEARAQKVSASLSRLTRLVDELFDVSRIAGGRMSIQPVPVDVSALAKDVAARFEDEARKTGCELRVTAKPGLEAVVDPERMDQVLTNLLSNAIKYGASRPVDLRVDGKDGLLRIEVADQGIGIAPEDHARIFGRFERAASIDHYGGLGLGLWIAQEIVRAHGGQVTVDSAPQKGATFTVILPMRVQTQD